MYSNRYTLLYAVSVTVTVAGVLALAASGLRGLQAANFARARRIAILETVMDVDPATLDADYDAHITEQVLDYSGNGAAGVEALDLDIRSESRKEPRNRRFPLYVYRNGNQTRYIVPIQGTGLWGPISAFLALDADRNTIRGVVFDHEKETPGMGAEIATAAFENQFVGKRLLGDDGTFESIHVLKGSGNDVARDPHAVDGVTGATMTSRGVDAMLRDELALYAHVFEVMAP